MLVLGLAHQDALGRLGQVAAGWSVDLKGGHALCYVADRAHHGHVVSVPWLQCRGEILAKLLRKGRQRYVVNDVVTPSWLRMVRQGDLWRRRINCAKCR
jgi:hypothetical protein